MKSRDVFKLSVSLVLLGVLLTLLLGLLLLPYGKQSETPSYLNRNPLKSQDNESQYTQASPENKLSFPQDHLPHKDYRHEWWYLTANLQSDTGMRFATQWTLFRTAENQAQWYFAHGELADTKVHLASFRQGREELANVTIIVNFLSSLLPYCYCLLLCLKVPLDLEIMILFISGDHLEL